jgi:hypothetical protein
MSVLRWCRECTYLYLRGGPQCHVASPRYRFYGEPLSGPEPRHVGVAWNHPTGCGGRVRKTSWPSRITAPARAGNRHFWRLSALRTYTKAPCKTDLHRKTLRALNRPGGPGQELDVDEAVREVEVRPAPARERAAPPSRTRPVLVDTANPCRGGAWRARGMAVRPPSPPRHRGTKAVQKRNRATFAHVERISASLARTHSGQTLGSTRCVLRGAGPNRGPGAGL